MTEVQPDSSQFLLTDPAQRHAGYARLRGAGSVRRIRLQSGADGWLVTGFETARKALTDTRLRGRTAAVGHGRRMPEHLYRAMNTHMMHAGPEDHARLRRIVNAAFTNRRIRRLDPMVQRLTDDLLDAIDGAQQADLISALALPLPLQVIGKLFGVPDDSAEAFHDFSTTLTAVVPTEELNATTEEMLEFVRDLLDRKRRAPEDDLLSLLAAARDNGERISDDELTSMVFLMLAAGHETTVGLIGNAIVLLLTNPDELAKVRVNPDLIPGVIDEALRMESPVQVTLRHALEPVELDGVTIPAGATVLIALLAANRDPHCFPEPDEFRLDRRDNPQLGFGFGYHYCLGAPLARLEGVIAVRSLLDRFPELALAKPAKDLVWRTSMVMHGLTELPVHLG